MTPRQAAVFFVVSIIGGACSLNPFGWLLIAIALGIGAVVGLAYLIGSGIKAGWEAMDASNAINSTYDRLAEAVDDGIYSVLRKLDYAISFQWLKFMPDWAQPIIWGIGAAIPLVVVIMTIRHML